MLIHGIFAQELKIPLVRGGNDNRPSSDCCDSLGRSVHHHAQMQKTGHLKYLLSL